MNKYRLVETNDSEYYIQQYNPVLDDWEDVSSHFNTENAAYMAFNDIKNRRLKPSYVKRVIDEIEV